jgi:hypothetical protein
MSDENLVKPVLFDPPQVRPDAAEAVRVERPPHVDAELVAAPPELRAVADDPALAAAVWQPADAQSPPDDADAAAQLAVALYLLQALHTPSRPGYEHLVREGEEEDEPQR